ncbi:hypothetical protein FISHEDRAFT_75894 [Fistulina hepatica ATCC 64428]|uniref:Uncharacterized protein n=1 Tax=Fistulina hepatica ATCC 64428 TaxID=1128425 RepID=A0A0D7A5F3_9AGAR|nr:hypothetical protein FISHEDRAFT_75894 [Fistulina hepatica ATCC 64428]
MSHTPAIEASRAAMCCMDDSTHVSHATDAQTDTTVKVVKHPVYVGEVNYSNDSSKFTSPDDTGGSSGMSRSHSASLTAPVSLLMRKVEMDSLDIQDVAVFVSQFIAVQVLDHGPHKRLDVVQAIVSSIKACVHLPINPDHYFYALHILCRLHHPGVIDLSASSIESLAQYAYKLFLISLHLAIQCLEDLPCPGFPANFNKMPDRRAWRHAVVALKYSLIVSRPVLLAWYEHLCEHPFAENFVIKRLQHLIKCYRAMGVQPAADDGSEVSPNITPSYVALVHDLSWECPVKLTVDPGYCLAYAAQPQADKIHSPEQPALSTDAWGALVRSLISDYVDDNEPIFNPTLLNSDTSHFASRPLRRKPNLPPRLLPPQSRRMEEIWSRMEAAPVQRPDDAIYGNACGTPLWTRHAFARDLSTH